MSDFNLFREAIDKVPDITPVYSRIAGDDVQYEHTASAFKSLLGNSVFAGQWCFPVGIPGRLEYPPFSERYPSTRWQRPNYLGLRYLLGGKYARHTGDDLDLPGYLDIGEPIHAPASGHVTYASFVPDSTWGNVLVIRLDLGNDNFVYTRFGHLNSIEVSVGDNVISGQLVAYVGNVGMPTSPHLHWDITKVNDPLLGSSPLNWPWDDLDFVQAHYIDPGTFVLGKMNPQPPSEKVWRRTTSALRVRSAPGFTEVLTVLDMGDRVEVEVNTVLRDDYNWTRVITSPSDTSAVGGFVASEFLKPDVDDPITTVWRRTTSGLRVRQLPDVDSTQITSLAYGARVEVETKTVLADTYNWAKVVSSPSNPLAVGYFIATEFLGPDADPKPPSPTPVVSDTVGIHVAYNGNVGDLMGVLDRAHRAGRPVPFVVVVSDPGLVSAIKRVSPNTVVIYRWVAGDEDPSPFDIEGRGDGAAWVHDLMRRHSQAPEADYHQFFNEVSFHGNNQSLTYARNVAETEMAMSRTLHAHYPGFKMTGGNYMPGVPEPEKYGEALRPLYDLLNANGDAVLFHWYSTPEADGSMRNGATWMCTRLLDYFGNNWPNMPIFIGEMGLYNAPRFRGVDSERATWLDTAEITRPYRKNGRKILIASWTIRGQDSFKWKYDDWTPHLNVYEADLRSGLLR